MLGGHCYQYSTNFIMTDSWQFSLSGTGELMKILTFNLWHGLGQARGLSLKPLESSGQRASRFEGFLQLAEEADPDLIFLQETNPTPEVARQIGHLLHLDEIHQVCNAGFRFLVGLPLSFQSGIVILAKKELGLNRLGTIKLPGSGRGWCWDRLSLQLSEHRYALFGRIEWKGIPTVVVVTHLHHTRHLDERTREKLVRIRQQGKLSSREHRKLLGRMEGKASRRVMQIRAIEDYLGKHYSGMPVILAGDFNAEPDSKEIQELVESHGFSDTYAVAGKLPGYTWDSELNPNVALSSGVFQEFKTSSSEVRNILREQDMRRSRIDYILLNQAFDPGHILSSNLFAENPLSNNQYCSDHFGILTTLRFP